MGVGYSTTSSKLLTQPELGHLQKSNIQPLNYLKEFRIDNVDEFEVGQVLNVDLLSIDQLVNIKGKTIGKGFSGNQKRHNFSRGPMTHGSKNHRAPGQIGNKNVTIKNSEILFINAEENILVLKGSLPG